MQILIPDSWLREYLQTNATVSDIQRCLSLCGPSIERLHEQDKEFIYDIEVTTNRVDCMSVFGIAREAAAILPQFKFSASILSDPFKPPLLKTAVEVDYLKVSVDPQLCPRFSAVLIQNITVKSSPDWLIKKLELAGMRSLNNVVDISNLLMLEMGQPVHTFDYDKISGRTMSLRESKPGEKITTLDNQTHTLPGHDIVIQDGSKNLIDLCGIMGGANSAIDTDSKNILVFVQTYEPVHIRKTSMSLGARSAAAVLFEKGLSPEAVLPTLHRGINLITSLAGGTCTPKVLDIYPTKQPVKTISLKQPLTSFASARLGINLNQSQISAILSSLNFQMKSATSVTTPWYRSGDVSIPEDLVEEIARIYGYHHLPSQLMMGELPEHPHINEFYWLEKLKSALAHWGYTETYTYSLVATDSGLKLKNPLNEDLAYLRTSLTPSHLEVVSVNQGRVSSINLFEVANVYLPKTSDLPEEQPHLIVTTTNLDYLKFKGLIQALLHQVLGLKLDALPFSILTHPNCLTCEINLLPIFSLATSVKIFLPISKYSPLIEDINVNLTQEYASLVNQIKAVSPLIKQVDLLDKYSTKITLRITYHSDDRQLSSADIKDIRTKLEQLFVA